MLPYIVPSSAIFAALSSLVLSVLAAPTAPALSVAVSGPDTVTDVENLILQLTVTNTGQQTLRLINDPQGPLTTSPTDSFLITGPNKVNPGFSGILYKYAGVDFVAANGESDHFTVLAAGQSVVITHGLSRAYNFTASGLGKYTIEVRNPFYYVDDNQRAVSIMAQTKTHQLTLNGKLSGADHEPDFKALATFVGCNATQQTQINAAITLARRFVFDAISFIQTHTTSSRRFTTWFGVFQETRRRAVLSNFNSLTTRGDEFTGWRYDCTLAGCNPGVFAYVYPNVFGVIHLCGAFWTAPANGTDSKPGTLVHEGTHFLATAGTIDIAYGKPACEELARTNPNQAIRNADSHEYFAENAPPLN